MEILAHTAKSVGDDGSWLVPTVTAFLGAAIAFVGQWLLSRQSAAKLRSSLIAAMINEVGVISRESAERVAASRRPGLALRRPLPTEAWRAVQASPVFGSLRATTRTAVGAFYADVAAANYEAAGAPTYLLIAALTTGPQSDSYDGLAMEVTTQPFASVRSQSIGVIEALREEQSRRWR